MSSQALWDRNAMIVKYCYPKGPHEGDCIQQQKVDNALKEWEAYSTTKFERVEEQDATLCITFDDSKSSQSYIHDASPDKPEWTSIINFAGIASNMPIASNAERAAILHEFGHVLGLLHEHNTSAHSEKPSVNIEDALRYYRNLPSDRPELSPEDMQKMYEEMRGTYGL